MCFRSGSCFGSGSGQDHGPWVQADHGGYYDSVDHKSGPQAYHFQPVVDNEAVRNAHYNNVGARKDHIDDAGGPGGHAAHAQDKADHGAPKHPAPLSGKVGDVHADHTYTARLQEGAAADPRQNAAADYHGYQTTTTTALARYY